MLSKRTAGLVMFVIGAIAVGVGCAYEFGALWGFGAVMGGMGGGIVLSS